MDKQDIELTSIMIKTLNKIKLINNIELLEGINVLVDDNIKYIKSDFIIYDKELNDITDEYIKTYSDNTLSKNKPYIQAIYYKNNNAVLYSYSIGLPMIYNPDDIPYTGDESTVFVNTKDINYICKWIPVNEIRYSAYKKRIALSLSELSVALEEEQKVLDNNKCIENIEKAIETFKHHMYIVDTLYNKHFTQS